MGALLGQVVVRAGRSGAVRARRAGPPARDRPAPGRRSRRAATARRGPGRAGPRVGRGGHRRLRAVLPARQPRRGARPGPGAAPTRARRARRRPRRLGRRGRRRAATRRPDRRRSSTSCSSACRSTLVLTAHPTEARRRTTLVALRRCAALLERLDDPRLTPSEDRDVRRRLREEITLLWRTADLRAVAPTPLDEARTAMAFFDATLFTVVTRLYRALDGAFDPPASAARRRRRDRYRADRDATAAGRAVPALGQLDRRRPRRQPGRHRRHHRAHDADPGRARPPRLRGGRDPAHADGRRGRVAGARGAAPGARASRATPRRCPRSTGRSAAGSPTSRIDSGSGSSPSACAGRGPR